MTTLPQTRTFITSLISSLPSTTPSTNQTKNPLRDSTPAQKSILLTLHVLFPNELLPALDLLDRDLVTRFILPSQTGSTSSEEADNHEESAAHSDPPHTQYPQSQPQEANTDVDVDVDMNTDQTPQDHISTSQADTKGPSRVNSRKTRKGRTRTIYQVRSAQHHYHNHSHSHSQHGKPSRYRDPLASTPHYEVRLQSWSCSCPAFAFSAFPASLTLSKSSLDTGSSSAPLLALGERIGDRVAKEGAKSETEGEEDAEADAEGEAEGEEEAGEKARRERLAHIATNLDGFEPRAEDADADADVNPDPDSAAHTDKEEDDWEVGGLSRGDKVPICKHLLACVLVDKTGLFAPFVKEREVGLEEWTGWAAGWGG